MADIAQLGLTIDSSQATQATAALNGLAAAAAPAQKAVMALGAAAAPANAALGTMAVATAHAASAHGGLSTQAMAASHSVRSMVEGFALGMPPMQVLMQQMNHLSYAASGEGGIVGAFREAGAVIGQFISPAMLAAGAVGAITIGLGAALVNIAKAELGFGELSERTGATVQSLHALASAAATEGIGSSEFLKGMTKFEELTDQASHKMGALAELFRAQPGGIAAGSMQENLAHVADLIHNATTEQGKYNLLQQLGLPPTREWVQLLGQGSGKLQEASNSAVQFGNSLDEKLIQAAREFAKEWNHAWNSFENSAKSTLVNVWGFLHDKLNPADLLYVLPGGAAFAGASAGITAARDRMPANFADRFSAAGAGTAGTSAFQDQLKNRGLDMAGMPHVAPSAQPTVDPAVLQKQMALEQQRISILGQTASVAEQVRGEELRIQAARLAGVNISAKEAATLKSNVQDRARGVDAMQASVDALHTEAGAYGMIAGDAAAYTAVQNKLNQAKRDGQTLTSADVAAIKSEASALGLATQNIDTMKTASDALGGAMKTFHTQLQNGATTFQALRQAALTALNAIEDKLIDIAAKNLIGSIFSGGAGGFSLSGLFGAHHSGSGPGDASMATRSVPLAAFIGAPRFHSGVGPGEVPAIIRDDESVLTPGQMRALGASRGGAALHISPTINVSGGAPGDDGQARKFAAMIADQVKRVSLETIRDQRRPGGILA